MLRTLLTSLLLGLLVSTAGAVGTPRVEVPIGDAPTRGPADAAVTMVEFIDFQ